MGTLRIAAISKTLGISTANKDISETYNSVDACNYQNQIQEKISTKNNNKNI